jgi:cell wall-associated NlpC family hydrolase
MPTSVRSIDAPPACKWFWIAFRAMLCVTGVAVAWERPVAAEQGRHESVQQGAGEGDRGESAEMDEAADATPHAGPYKSPYALALRVPQHELLFDAAGPRGTVAAESALPPHEWYGQHVRKEFGSWGAPARQFDCPAGVWEKPVAWRRERVVAAAARFIGYEYQHHHIPDWDPPDEWPWKQCCGARHGKGMDCSNFSGWNYNWAFGIHLNTGIHEQAEQAKARSAHGELHARVIPRPDGKPGEWYDDLVQRLEPGDLLYIRNNKQTHVTHVIMWLGRLATSPDGVPLVIDSTGGRIKDTDGHAIPCGIHLRPFRKGSWYHSSFAHAHRWIH